MPSLPSGYRIALNGSAQAHVLQVFDPTLDSNPAEKNGVSLHDWIRLLSPNVLGRVNQRLCRTGGWIRFL